MVSQQRIVIVGAGIVGLSTAYALLSRGVRQVTVLEQEAVDHPRSTSHGNSRLFRFEYGSDLFYSNMARLSLNRWKRLEHLSKRTLYTQTGLLVLSEAGDTFAQASSHTLHELGLPNERLSKHHCKQRFPQFSVNAHEMFTYNTEAGILHASACLRTLKDAITSLGGKIYESCRVTQIVSEGQHRPVRIYCNSDDELAADRVVLATGPWVHRLLADLHLPVQLTRQYILYFAGLPISSYGVNAFPAFMTPDLYGFPIHKTYHGQGSNWLKAASHSFGVPIDPDEVLPPDERVIARTVRGLRDILPALEQAELAHIDSCMYDVTPDEDFILDRLPHDPRVVFATGLTGHGFKFGLLLGELMSSLVCDTVPPVPMERFQLARFSHIHQDVSVA